MEGNKLHSLNKIVETDDGYKVVLELPETDSFFVKKKDLLGRKGYQTSEQVDVKRSVCPSAMAGSLDKMLEIARIMHLDEVELYFGEVDENYYSVRNEVEALHLLFALTSSSISCKQEKEINVLLALKNMVVDRIRELTEKNKMEMRTDENYCCKKEESLLEWGKSNGMKSRLKIAAVEGAGRGAIATEDLQVGDIALEIPLSIVISEELVKNSDMGRILDQVEGMSPETMLLLWSMKEKHSCNSKFKLYFDSLPEEFNTGLSFGMEAIVALDGTLLLEEIMQAKEHLRGQYGELVPALCSEYPDMFLPELYTWEQFLWACELWYSNSMKVLFADGKLRTCLIPIAGFLNHSIYPHIIHYGKADPTANTLKFSLSRPCGAGEQCFLSYGNYSGSHLVTFYGFLPQGDNPYDVIPLDIDAGEVSSTEDSSTYNWTTHMVRGTWFSKNLNIFCYGLPPPLLDYLRGSQTPTEEVTKPTLEIEMEILENLHSTFVSMMDNFGEAETLDRDINGRDVKLAHEYKDLQRRIVSSVITSISAGIQLVQNELAKCLIE